MDSMGPLNGDKPLAVQPRLNPPESVATLEFKSVIAKDRRSNDVESLGFSWCHPRAI